MKFMSLPTVWTVAAVVAAAITVADTAHARASFDGAWAVTITTQRGDCDSGSGFGVDIHDGGIYGRGGFSVSGHVAPSGAVTVQIASGSSSASGSGRLSGNSGGGIWHGVGSRGACSGHWSAGRR
jgi:hypothetical protein